MNHFIRGRLYDKDLKNDAILETIGGRPIKIQRKLNKNVTVNNASIIEAEVFVYNLGTMFYINEILHPEVIQEKDARPKKDINDTEMNDEMDDDEPTTEIIGSSSTSKDVELITKPGPHRHHHMSSEDEFDDLDEIVTPRVLPVKYQDGNK